MRIINVKKPLSEMFVKRQVTWGKVSTEFGNVFRGKHGKIYNRDEQFDPNDPLLPFVLSNKVLIGELIPHTSWGSSLANMLTKSSWDKLRHPVIQSYQNSCQVCGCYQDTLDVHEIWSYRYLGDNEGKSLGWGVQHLDGLICVCKACHECFHLGYANVNNRLQIAIERLRKINGWSAVIGNRYYDIIADRWEESNKVKWILDFSGLEHPDGGLTISTIWSFDAQGFLNKGENKTIITNIPWKFTNETNWRGETQFP